MRLIFPTWAVPVALASGILATGCQSSVAPSAPRSETAPTGTGFADASAVSTAAGQANVTPEQLDARGWDCRALPFNPALVTCSGPNQTHPLTIPGPPPPDDRPASITLMVFENGAFIGTSVLIRSDLYNGQPCRSTGGAYTFIPRIGFYECLHQSSAP
jgi:hypothetical protein